MKYLNLFAILITALGFLAFKPDEKSVRIQEEINLNTNFKEFYTYTAAGRIASLINSVGDTFLYEYIGDRIVWHSLRNAATDTLKLNNNNYVEVYKGACRVYNDNGFRVQESSVTGNLQWYISNGNISSHILLNEYGKPGFTITYLYYPDKENCMGNVNKGQDFLGQESKNLIHKIVGIGANGDTLARSTYYYEFDTLDRVTKRIIYKNSEASADSFAFVYY